MAAETLVYLPNMEAIVSAFLRDQTELDADLADRIYTALPGTPTFPAVRVNQYDAVNVTTRPLWVVRASLQIEAWGGSKTDAFRIATTCAALLDARLEGVHTTPTGTVTGVEIGPLRDFPDPSYEPAKPRWLFTAYVTAHP